MIMDNSGEDRCDVNYQYPPFGASTSLLYWLIISPFRRQGRNRMPRTDHDSWDLATSVGATATMVAAARAIATNADNRLIDDQFAEPLVRAVGVDFFTRWVSGELAAADVDEHESGWKLEHMPNAMAARTRFFDNFFRDATQAGIRQAVILASGLDARAYRLEWPADMTVFEIDQPRVIEFKTATLANLGAAPTVDRRTVAVDLRHDWPTALVDAGLDTNRPTAWIAEGLFGYLPPEAQDRLLDNITTLSADGSRLASEAVPNMSQLDIEKAREMMREATAKWRDHGFDLDFADLGYEGERNDVATYLERLGWESVGTPMTQLLADNGIDAIPQTNDSVSVAHTVYYTSVLSKR
jgi:methyltransferase (TIGR00027 family)